MNSGLKVSTKKPTETWDELGIKWWVQRNPLKPGMNSGLKVSSTKPTETWDELGIKGEQYETH